MPNQLDGTGLQIKTLIEIVSDITAGLQSIFGTDINLDSNSPDGQWLNIVAQAAIDNLELLQQTYASFDPDQAVGVQLDQRFAINGVPRQAGTFTMTPADITVSGALTLPGLDSQLLIDSPTGTIYTISDDAGNQYYLAATTVFSGAGTVSCAFRAANRGAVLTTLNTIQNQVTVTQGVTTVNNSAVATSIGVDEESDIQYKIRRANMFNLAATGPADAIEAAILAIPGVTDAVVMENDTNAPVGGVPANSIWAIVENGVAAQIGQVIYAKKVPGCGQKGSSSYVVTRPNGSTFTAKWDTPLYTPLKIRFAIEPSNGTDSFDTGLIATQLAAALTYKLNQSANIGQIIQAMFTVAPNGYLTAVGVSVNGTDWYDTLSPSDYQHKFTVSSTNITVTT